MMSISAQLTPPNTVKHPPLIGGEFTLDPLLLDRLPEETMWRGLPHWESPGTTYLAAGRMAMIWGLQAYGAEPGDIWVPEYLCESVIHSLQREGWRPRPYPLHDDLTVDLEAWADCWNGSSAACLLVHYFGFPQPPAVWEFLEEHRVRPLVEDRTHDLWNTPATQATDVAFASLRKWFALPDGGLVRLRNISLSRTSPIADPHWAWVRHRLMIGTARYTFLDAPEDDLTSEPYFLGMIERAERCLNHDSAIRKISPLSWRLLQTYNISNLVARRRSNYERLAKALSGHPRVHLIYPALPPNVCPFGCPVICNNRDSLRAHLKAIQIYCAVHWPMNGWSTNWVTRHAVDLNQRLLTLPIDQRMEPEDIDRLSEAVWSDGI